jgi:hypothetical protein
LVKPSGETVRQEETAMLPSASVAGALVGILAVAAIAVHMLVDIAFRAFGG